MLRLKTGQQLGNPKLFRPDPLKWIECSVQYVIATTELTRAFHGNDVTWVFHDAEN